jgi:hypothetical protein
MAAVNKYNFLRWYRNTGSNTWDSLFASDFSQWQGTTHDNAKPVGFDMLPGTTSQRYVENDSNRCKLSIISVGSQGLYARHTFRLIDNGKYKISFDLIEASGFSLEVQEFKATHTYNTPGSYSIEVDVNNDATATHVQFGTIGVATGYVIVDNFKVEKLNSEIIIDETEPSLPPRSYVKDNGSYFPVMIPGETTAFVLNANFIQEANFELRILKEDQDVSGKVADMAKAYIDDTTYQLYCSITNPDLAKGFYRLAIYMNDSPFLVSNPVFITYQSVNTSLVEFRHDRLLFGVHYEVLPNDFYQVFRLAISEIDRQVEYNKDQYRSISSSKLRNFLSKVDRYVKFESYYFDEIAHEAAGAMVEHDEIYINSQKYIFKTGYKADTDVLSRISKGSFELWEDDYSQDAEFDNNQTIEVEYADVVATGYDDVELAGYDDELLTIQTL